MQRRWLMVLFAGAWHFACGEGAADPDSLGANDAGVTDRTDGGVDAGPLDGTDGTNGACSPPRVLTTPTADFPRGTEQVELRFEFSEPVAYRTGLASWEGPGSFDDIDSAGSELLAVVTGLFNGATGRLTLPSDAVTSAACGAPLDDDLVIDVSIDAEDWEHVGPITTAELAPTEGPWFIEVTETAGFGADGVDSRAMLVDFDGDGHDDLVTVPVSALPLTPRFFRNLGGDGGFGFEEVTETSGMAGTPATTLVFGDVDNDGDPDAVVLTGARSPDGANGVWFNDGAGRFSFGGARGIESSVIGQDASGNRYFHEPAAATLADFDRDGDLDLYLGRFYVQILTPGGDLGSGVPTDDQLYRNEGDGSFSLVNLPEQLNPLTEPYLAAETAALTGRAAYGLAMGDWDDDGDLDVFVNNYGAGRPILDSPPRYWDHNFLWRVDPGLTFVDVAMDLGVDATFRGTTVEDEDEVGAVNVGGTTYPGPIGGNGFGCVFDDFDNDGDLDLISATIAHPDYPQSDRTLLFVNDGGTFTEESRARGLQYAEDELHPVFVDVDQDGLAELVMSRLRDSRLEMYLQTPEHDFELQSYATTGVEISRPGPTLWTDLDADGDLDFFMPKGAGRVFENRAGEGRNWLQVKLRASAPRDATGARVTVQTSAGQQTAEVVGGHGHYNTQPSRWLHFGLGGDSGAEAVTIRWPDGQTRTFGPVRANQALFVEQSGSIESRARDSD